MTEEDVKNQLGIKDFRHIKKNQLIEFVSSIPNMDREVAIKCIEQFPRFKEYSNIIVDHFYTLCDKALSEDNKDDIETYREILDELKRQLRRRKITKNDRHLIIQEMVSVGEHMDLAIERHHKHKSDILKLLAFVSSIAIATGGALLGVKMSKS